MNSYLHFNSKVLNVHFKNAVRLAEIITRLVAKAVNVALRLNKQLHTLLKAKMLEKLRTEE